MLAAIKGEIHRLSMDAVQLESPDRAAWRSGVLTGLTRTLELCELEEQLAGESLASSD